MPFGMGFGELVLILVIVVVVFGATKLPQLGDGLGQGDQEFQARRELAERDRRVAGRQRTRASSATSRSAKPSKSASTVAARQTRTFAADRSGRCIAPLDMSPGSGAFSTLRARKLA